MMFSHCLEATQSTLLRTAHIMEDETQNHSSPMDDIALQQDQLTEMQQQQQQQHEPAVVPFRWWKKIGLCFIQLAFEAHIAALLLVLIPRCTVELVGPEKKGVALGVMVLAGSGIARYEFLFSSCNIHS